jgi:hypothetical protein
VEPVAEFSGVVVGTGVPEERMSVEAGAVLNVLLPNVGVDEGPTEGLPVGAVRLPVGDVSGLLEVLVVGRALESVMGKSEVDGPVDDVNVGTTLLLP